MPLVKGWRDSPLLIDGKYKGKVKTVTTLAWVKATGLDKWIIVAPKTVIGLTWEREVPVWLKEANVYKAYKPSGNMSVDKRKEVYEQFNNDENLSVLLISKDTFKRDVLNYFIQGQKRKNPHFKFNLLGNILNDYGIIIDEATFLKNVDSIQSKVLCAACHNAEYTMCLTGTPTPKKPIDIFGIMYASLPSIFHSKWNIAEYFFGTDFWGTVYADFKDDDLEKEWTDWLSEFGTRHTQKEVMKWLPEVVSEEIQLKMTTEQTKRYNKIRDEFKVEYSQEEMRISSLLAQMTYMIIETSNADGIKGEWLLDYLEAEEEEVVLVVSRFTNKILLPLKERIDKAGFSCELISGESSTKERQDIVDKVNKGEVKVLLAQIQTVSEAIKLPRVDTLIFLDKWPSDYVNKQVSARFLPTSKEEVNERTKKIISLVIPNSIDEAVKEMVEKSIEASKYLENFGYKLLDI